MFKIQVPFSMILAGPSGCGKSTFAYNLLRNLKTLTDTDFKTILWCYSEHGSIGSIPKIPNLQVCQGIPAKIGTDNSSPKLLVVDDLMTDKKYESQICDLFIKGSHHRNISILFICQNIFHQSRFFRTISLNAKYLVLFKNVRDRSQFFPLARQLCPENPTQLLNVYKECTNKPYGYLMVDLNQETPDIFRFRTDIFNKDFSSCYCAEEDLRQNEAQRSIQTFEGQQAYFVYT